jgi:4'-phosphopantetheinyl transferase
VTAPRRFPLPAPGEAHVWWIDLGAPAGDAGDILSPDERSRAARFHHERDRVRWVRCHAAVREILGGYLGLPPNDVQFASSERLSGQVSPAAMSTGSHFDGSRRASAVSAKPALRTDARLRFNLAHAGDRAVLALALEREVGIDLEPITADLTVAPLLGHVCTPDEAAGIASLPARERIAAFLRLWTAKEAYLKAIGLGLFREPRRLHVEFLADSRAVVHDADAAGDAPQWDVRWLDAGPGWVAALAVEGANQEARMFAWPVSPYASS